jgi:hypothetical protein
VSISEIARADSLFAEHGKGGLGQRRAAEYVRARLGSLVDEYEPRIRELLRAFPRMPATVIAERVGFDPYVELRVAELRPAYLPPDPASRTAYAAGEIAQCDFRFPMLS